MSRIQSLLLGPIFALLAAGCTAGEMGPDDDQNGPDTAAEDDGGEESDDLPDASGSEGSDSEPVLAIDGSVWTRTITDPEVDCLWGKGYRHAIFGTQLLEVTRSQLEVAIRGGMTVDLYVYLYWEDVVAQIEEAVELTEEFPEIGKIWIDLEEDPKGRSAEELIALTEDAIDATAGVPYGIYTGKGFWQGAMANTEAFSDLPLWYARYDGEPSLETYSAGGDHAFGGWQAAAGKQWDDHTPHLCDLPVDKNTMFVSQDPAVVVDRDPPADDGDPPPAPVELLPNHGQQITTSYVKPTAPTIGEATSYEIELQFWDGGQFRPYWTTARETSDLMVSPVVQDTTFRWRMRAKNAHGIGPWSEWAWFDFGDVSDGPTLDQIYD